MDPCWNMKFGNKLPGRVSLFIMFILANLISTAAETEPAKAKAVTAANLLIAVMIAAIKNCNVVIFSAVMESSRWRIRSSSFLA